MNKPLSLLSICVTLTAFSSANDRPYTLVDTNQAQCASNGQISEQCSKARGQDSQYSSNSFSYQRNPNGTVNDLVTGLMWTQSTDTNGDGKINAQDKLTYDEAMTYAKSAKAGGYSDWRVPTIKELYSLILFDGTDPSGMKSNTGTADIIPFLDHTTFDIAAGDTDAGERTIDSQFISQTKYVSKTMKTDETVFGVNFIDGRIKGYGMSTPRGEKTFYTLLVRGNTQYGENDFSDSNSSTITDNATGLTWQQGDSQTALSWNSAISYCETLTLAGVSDWRLPNAKELQSIVDYTRSPDTTNSPAINKLFKSTSIINEAKQKDWGNYWSNTLHINSSSKANAVYISFGRSMGNMNGQWIDVHGAGAQRSDPIKGDASQYTEGHGPQGDSVRINNMARCVSGGNIKTATAADTMARSTISVALDNRDMSQQNKPGQNQKTPNNDTHQSNRLFAQMDRNNDGKLSKQEVKGPLAQDFKRFDRNNDGYLTQDELPPAKNGG